MNKQGSIEFTVVARSADRVASEMSIQTPR